MEGGVAELVFVCACGRSHTLFYGLLMCFICDFRRGGERETERKQEQMTLARRRPSGGRRGSWRLEEDGGVLCRA